MITPLSSDNDLTRLTKDVSSFSSFSLVDAETMPVDTFDVGVEINLTIFSVLVTDGNVFLSKMIPAPRGMG